MNEALPPDLPGGVARALETLRHALADPLSAAGVKLELLERRLAAAPSEAPSLADRVRGVKADLAAAGRLIDLLPRLSGIACEPAGETSLADICRVAGVPLEGESADRPRLLLRRLATTDALRSTGGLPPFERPRGRVAPAARRKHFGACGPADRGPRRERRCEPRAALPPAARPGAEPRISSSRARASNPTEAASSSSNARAGSSRSSRGPGPRRPGEGGQP